MRPPSSSRAARLAAATAACAALVPLHTTLTAPAPAEAADSAQRSSFLLPVLPDTQFYSRYATPETGNLFKARYGSEPFAVQTQWLADNHDELDLPFVMHLGDVVDQHGKSQEWDVAEAAMKTLTDNGVSYSILAGNHDLANSSQNDAQRDLSRENYPKRFTTAEAAAQPTFGGRHSSGFHEWHTFTAEGRTFLNLAMSWQASDDAIAWANEVIADHPNLPVILTTHEILGIAGDGVTATDTPYGLKLWDRLIKDNDQIFLTLSGHNHGAAHVRKTNAKGHSVDQILLDYQMAYQGGNAYLGLLEFDFTNDRIDTTVVSPWIRLKPADTLIAEYDRAVRPGANENLRLDIDWDARFGDFEGPVTVPAPSGGSLIEAAKASVREGYTEPEVEEPVPPHDADDYPKVDGTVAHWRFGGTAGTIAPGATVEDIAGDNDLTRVALDAEPDNAPQLEDVRRSADHAFLSADAGSACFANAKSPKRISYLQTAPTAPVNGATFPQGYTIESFIKIDASWTPQNGAWMGALTRDGRRADIAGLTPGDPDEPLFTLAVSSLREVQWNAAATSPLRERSNWSGEIMADRWIHVAAVNDPKVGYTTLYVDGAPVLRNPTDGGIGLATGNKPWRIGSSTWEGKTADGWLGCVGETRIVERPLDRSQWLTARTYVAPQPEPQNPGTPGTPGGEDPKPGQPRPDTPATGGGAPGTPAPAPSPAPGPAQPAPAPAQPAPGPVKPAPAAVKIGKPTLKGNRFSVPVSGAARVRIALRRCTSSKRCAKKPARTYAKRLTKAGRVTVALPRTLRRGRYRVEVTVTSGGKTVRRTMTVRLR